MAEIFRFLLELDVKIVKFDQENFLPNLGEYLEWWSQFKKYLWLTFYSSTSLLAV